eukprot:gene10256-7788_t
MVETIKLEGAECIVIQVESVCVYIFGTAHVCQKSVEDAEKLVNFLNPSVVFLELCKERAFLLDRDPRTPIVPNKGSISWKMALQHVREGRMDLILQHVIAAFYAKVSKDIELETFPGAEFAAAAAAAKACGAGICLGDRPVSITLKRTWSALSLWEKIKFLFSGLQSFFVKVDKEMIESLMNGIDGMLEEFQAYLPSASQTLLHERNQIMATDLHRIAHELHRQQPSHALQGGSSMFDSSPTVLAIVGKGHMTAMASLINSPLDHAAYKELWNPVFIHQDRPSHCKKYVKTVTISTILVACAVVIYRMLKS